MTTRPLWIPCPDCDDFLCTLHHLHAYDCACPAIEDMTPEQRATVYGESKGPGRPREGRDELTRIASTRLTGAEFAALERILEARGMSVAQGVREAIRVHLLGGSSRA